MLPQHPPEILGGLSEGALCGQVSLLLSESKNQQRKRDRLTFLLSFTVLLEWRMWMILQRNRRKNFKLENDAI